MDRQTIGQKRIHSVIPIYTLNSVHGGLGTGKLYKDNVRKDKHLEACPWQTLTAQWP